MFKDRPRERQIEFPPMHTHPPIVTAVSLGLALACVVAVIMIRSRIRAAPSSGPGSESSA
jgi:hypothetical protein